MLRRISFLAVAAVGLLLLGSQFTSTASAGPWEPEDGWIDMWLCVTDPIYAPNGTTVWFEAGTYFYPKTHYWLYRGIETDPEAYFGWPELTQLGPCPEISPTQVDAAFGDELDLWHGSCGMYFPSSPFTGLASLGPAAAPEGLNLLRGACGLTVTGADQQVIANPVAGLYYYYYELNQHLYSIWEDGGLGLFVYDASVGMWNECSSFHIDLDLENDDYGRVACVANYLGTFGIAEK